MLFVDPQSQGKGAGTALLNFAKERHASLELEENEDNPKGARFCQSQGFAFAERLPLGGEGRPYPLLRLV